LCRRELKSTVEENSFVIEKGGLNMAKKTFIEYAVVVVGTALVVPSLVSQLGQTPMNLQAVGVLILVLFGIYKIQYE